MDQRSRFTAKDGRAVCCQVHGQDPHSITVPAIEGGPPFTGDIEPLPDPHQFSCCAAPLKRSGAPALSREFRSRQHESSEHGIRRHASTLTARPCVVGHRRRYVDGQSHPGRRVMLTRTLHVRHRRRREQPLDPIATYGPDITCAAVAFGYPGRNRVRKPPDGLPAGGASAATGPPTGSAPPLRITSGGPDCDVRARHNRLNRRFRAPGTQPGSAYTAPHTKGPRCRSSGALPLELRQSEDYLMILVTRPEPTVRPPSRIAKPRPSSIAIGWMSATVISVLSPGITISVPSGRVMTPVTSVVRK